MSEIRSESRIGRRNLVGRKNVTVDVVWVAEANDDLSVIDQRRARCVLLDISGITEATDFSTALDVEHAVILRDLLDEAIKTTLGVTS